MTSIWLQIFWLSLQLALWVVQSLERQKYIAEGEANALKSLLDQSNDLLKQIQLTRTNPVPGVAVPDEFDRNPPKPGADTPKNHL